MTLKHRTKTELNTRRTEHDYTHVVVAMYATGEKMLHRVASWHKTEQAAKTKAGSNYRRYVEKVNGGVR